MSRLKTAGQKILPFRAAMTRLLSRRARRQILGGRICGTREPLERRSSPDTILVPMSSRSRTERRWIFGSLFAQDLQNGLCSYLLAARVTPTSLFQFQNGANNPALWGAAAIRRLPTWFGPYKVVVETRPTGQCNFAKV